MFLVAAISIWTVFSVLKALVQDTTIFCLEPGSLYKDRAVAVLPDDMEAILGSTKPPEEINWIW